MSEVDSSPEQQEALSKATHEVVALYMGDQMEALLGGFQGQETRDSLWAETAQEYPAYADKIRELRQATQAAAADKKAYAPQVINLMKLSFMTLEDPMAQEYLGDVVLARMTTHPGYLDYGMNPAQVVPAMAEEMGIQGGWRSEEAKKVTLENAVSATLAGKLKVSYQPKGQLSLLILGSDAYCLA